MLLPTRSTSCLPAILRTLFKLLVWHKPSPPRCNVVWQLPTIPISSLSTLPLFSRSTPASLLFPYCPRAFAQQVLLSNVCVWQSHSLENLFLILTPANESEKLLVFISSSSLPQIPIISTMYSDTPRSVCGTEPQTELSRPLEGPSPIPDFS